MKVTDASCVHLLLTVAHFMWIHSTKSWRGREVLTIHDLAVLQCAASDCSREEGRAACTEAGELIVGGVKD